MSSLLSAVLLPAAMWGLLSSLILQLIALRGLFIHGGESKLRFATLAFALGIVLVQRLVAQQGKETGRMYGAALGASMLLFSIAHTLQWREGFNPWLMLAGNIVLLGLLWWAGNKVTAACAVDRNSARVGGESGILGGREDHGAGTSSAKAATADQEPMVWMGEPEGPAPGEADTRTIYDEFMEMQQAKRDASRKRLEASRAAGAASAASQESLETWSAPLSGPHPGRSLIGFALVAIPLFGLGELLAGGDAEAGIHLAIRLFLYLWCSLTLLWIAGMGQLRAYFEQRGLSLPDVCGMTWIGVGSTAVFLALALAFLLPQPASPGSNFIRERIEATYMGVQSNRGVHEAGKGTNTSQKTPEGDNGSEDAASRKQAFKADDKAAEKGKAESAQEKGADAEKRESQASQAVKETDAGKLFSLFLRVLFAVFLFVIVAALIVAGFLAFRALREGLQGLRVLRRPRAAKAKRRKRPGEKEAPRAFAAFADPFLGAGELKDGDALVRYLWAATLAFYLDRGLPLEPGATPLEIAETAPAPPEEFRERVRWLARLLCFSEFSGQPVPETERPNMQGYWTALQTAARQAGG